MGIAHGSNTYDFTPDELHYTGSTKKKKNTKLHCICLDATFAIQDNSTTSLLTSII